MRRKIRVGLVGLNAQRGWAHDAHLPALRALSDDYVISAACASRQENAEAAAKALNIPHAFADAAALARHPEVDLVVVTVKVPEHDRLVRAALDAGKHVWCEWPLAMDTGQGDALARMADAKGVRHVIGLQSRASPVIRRVRELVREGYVGQVRSSTMIGSGMAWGAFTDQANVYNLDAKNRVTLATVPFGHFIDAFAWCLSPLTEVQALESRLYEQTLVIESGAMAAKTAIDQLLVQGRLANGAVAAIHYRGGMAKGTNLHWEINGTDGDLVVTSPVLGHLQLAPLQLRGGRGQEQQTVTDLEIPNVNAAIPQGMGWNVGHLYAAIAPSLRDPATTLPEWVATFHDANRVHRVIETVERAAAEGRRLSIA